MKDLTAKKGSNCMKQGLVDSQEWKTNAFILNLSADLLLKVSQAFKNVLLMVAGDTSELALELNFWEKTIQDTSTRCSSCHPEELATPSLCKKD